MMKITQQKFRKHPFTLVELIVSMAVFALLSMMVVQLFSASQKLWVSNNQKNTVSAEGRTALNLIASLLSTTSACAKVNAQDAQSADKITANQGGVDYLKVDAPANAPSRLYFVTKTSHPGIQDGSDLSTCFVGIQVIDDITSTSDPDSGCNALVMSVKTDKWGSYHDQFPEVQFSDIKTALDSNIQNFQESSTSDDNNINIARLATCVVDFKVRLYNVEPGVRSSSSSPLVDTTNLADHIADRTSYSDSRDPDTDPDDADLSTPSSDSSSGPPPYTYPAAIELELVLMDRTHYQLYKDASATEKTQLKDQYGCTFRRLIWLGVDRHMDDYNSYN